MDGKGDGGPREGTEEWPEMSRLGSGVGVTESLWGGMSRIICRAEENEKAGLGMGKMPGVEADAGARWTVTATSASVRGIGFA